MSIKIRNIKTMLHKEGNDSYSIMCSAFGVYSVGKTRQDTLNNFSEALDLHLSVMRKKALEID